MGTTSSAQKVDETGRTGDGTDKAERTKEPEPDTTFMDDPIRS
jgi:hypothetical protein